MELRYNYVTYWSRHYQTPLYGELQRGIDPYPYQHNTHKWLPLDTYRHVPFYPRKGHSLTNSVSISAPPTNEIKLPYSDLILEYSFSTL